MCYQIMEDPEISKVGNQQQLDCQGKQRSTSVVIHTGAGFCSEKDSSWKKRRIAQEGLLKTQLPEEDEETRVDSLEDIVGILKFGQNAILSTVVPQHFKIKGTNLSYLRV
jgi:hypothetical protein